MGLFDDITNFVNEAQSLRKEATQLGNDVVKEIVNGAADMKQTVADTTDEIKSAIEPGSTPQDNGASATDEQ